MAVTINASTSSGLVTSADTSGTVEIQSNGTTKFTVATTGAYGQLVSGTAVSASSTSVDFTSIPSWVKRITVMLNGVSTNGTSGLQIQIGSGSVTTSGYTCYVANIDGTNATSVSSPTTGFVAKGTLAAANIYNGTLIINLLTGNTWTCTNSTSSNTGVATFSNGSLALGGTLDRVRITTIGGTDTFDAGTINILYEG